MEVVEKNETSRFLRNCVSYISFALLIDILTSIGLFRGPLPTIPISRNRAHLAKVAKESKIVTKI